MSDSSWPHGLQHARLPCPLHSPRVCSDSCPLSWRCHPTSHLCRPLLLPSIFPSIRVFSSELFFQSGGQNIGVSASASILPMNIQGCFLLGLTGLISLQSKGHSRVFSSTIIQKASIHQCSAFFVFHLSHPYMTTVKTIALTIMTLVGKVMPLLFNTLFVTAFLPRSKNLLISRLQSPSTVIRSPRK